MLSYRVIMEILDAPLDGIARRVETLNVGSRFVGRYR